MTAYLQTDAGILAPANVRPLNESVRFALTVDLLESRIAELESRLQEDGWQRLNDGAGREFSRDAIGAIAELARVMYLKNGLVNRAVEIGALYVWGQDLSVSAVDEGVQAVVDRFWAENARTLTGQQASRSLDVELTVTGNVFLALFPDPVSGLVRVRSVPMEEVRAIVTNPDDRYEPWFYKRCWDEQPVDGGPTVKREALYPDWRYLPEDRPTSVPVSTGGSIEVRWGSPIAHVKVGAFAHWKWGVSEVYAALDWARAYTRMLENDATRSASLARWAYKLTTEGGSQGVAAAKARLNTTLGTPGGETNPPPVAGSTYIRGNKNQDLDPIDISRAILPPEHSRPVRLMTSAALGISDHFFDSDVGNHATASTLDRPTELRYSERRQLWRDVFAALVQWAIDRDLEAPAGLLGFTPNDEARAVDLSWPDLLERSVTERVGAVREAATLNGQDLAGTMPRELVAREMMVALGVEDIDDQMAALEDEWAEQDARREEMAQLARRAPQNPQNPQNPPPGGDDATREAFVAALRELRETLRAGAR